MWRLIVFDLDGTLVDSRRDIADAINVLIDEYGGQRLDQARIIRMVGDGADVLVHRALSAALAQPMPAGALQRFVEIYDRCLLNHTTTYPGIPEVLEQTARRATLALLTNKPEAASRRILSGLSIERFFTHVIGGDGPLGKKPDPVGLRHLMAAAGTSAAETLLVGDSVVDLRTAAAAGTAICLARYGFGFEDLPPEELRGGELVLDDPLALLPLLRGAAGASGAVR